MMVTASDKRYYRSRMAIYVAHTETCLNYHYSSGLTESDYLMGPCMEAFIACREAARAYWRAWEACNPLGELDANLDDLADPVDTKQLEALAKRADILMEELHEFMTR